MKEVFYIRDLEQLRLLSDPLKLRLIQAFGERESTVAEAAKALEEPLTKLYRHVDALLGAGLIEVTRERQKRGTVERRFRAVARRFEVENGLLSRSNAGAEDDSVRALFRDAEREVLAALSENDESFRPTFARFRVKATPEQLEKLQQRLFVWLDEMEAEETPGPDALDVGALIALYRIPGSGP